MIEQVKRRRDGKTHRERENDRDRDDGARREKVRWTERQTESVKDARSLNVSFTQHRALVLFLRLP